MAERGAHSPARRGRRGKGRGRERKQVFGGNFGPPVRRRHRKPVAGAGVGGGRATASKGSLQSPLLSAGIAPLTGHARLSLPSSLASNGRQTDTTYAHTLAKRRMSTFIMKPYCCSLYYTSPFTAMILSAEISKRGCSPRSGIKRGHGTLVDWNARRGKK